MTGINGYLYRLGRDIFEEINNYKFEVRGNPIPPQAVIASNHYGSLDPLLIMQGLGRNIVTIGRYPGEWFRAPYFIPRVGRIALSDGLREAFTSACEYTSQGYSLLIFPEGYIENKIHEEEIGEMKRGVFCFARQLKLPVIPIAIKGVEKIWPKKPNSNYPLLDGRVSIAVGKEINPMPADSKACEYLRKEITRLYGGLD